MRGCLDTLKERRTVYEFIDKEVPDSCIGRILEAGRWAPSSHNTQPWSFILIKDKETISSLMDICYYGGFHTNPTTIIALVLEPLDSNKKGLLKKGKIKKMAEYHKYIDIGQPILAMVMEAQCENIGSCIISPVVKDANKILNVPKDKKAILLLGLGYEKQDAFHPKKERKEMKDILFYEKYGRK